MMGDLAAWISGLQALLPQGWAFTRAPTAKLTALLHIVASAVYAAQLWVEQILNEYDPRRATQLLPDWERLLGLPDHCSGVLSTSMSERRRRAFAKLSDLGGQSATYFVALAAANGYAITITEFAVHTVNSSVAAPLNGMDWAYAWQVNAAANRVIPFTVTDDVAMPLALWSEDVLECLINQRKPAHTHVLFAYSQ